MKGGGVQEYGYGQAPANFAPAVPYGGAEQLPEYEGMTHAEQAAYPQAQHGQPDTGGEFAALDGTDPDVAMPNWSARPQVDSYSAEFYPADYNATGTAETHYVPGRASGRMGRKRTETYAPEASMWQTQRSIATQRSRAKIMVALGTLATLLLVVLALAIGLYFAPKVTTAADPVATSGPSNPSGPGGGPDSSDGTPETGENDGGGGAKPTSQPVDPAMQTTVVGTTFTIPTDPENPDAKFTFELGDWEANVDYTKGLAEDIGLYLPNGYRYVSVEGKLTNNSAEAVDYTDRTLQAFVRSTQQDSYRTEVWVETDSPYNSNDIKVGETQEVTFFFPVKEDAEITQLGFAPVGQWWDYAVWVDLPAKSES